MKALRLEVKGVPVIEHVDVADSFCSRLKGLIGRSDLPAGHALYIPHCNCVHTFFMRFNLDLVFVDRSMRVRKIVRNVPPRRVIAGGLRSAGVLELQSREPLAGPLEAGTLLELKPACVA